MDYNSKVAQSKKIEEANFARIQGNIARQQAKIAQMGNYSCKQETSLLTYEVVDLVDQTQQKT
jgi:hypothetical protein